jgi:hypothetical protein
MDLISCWHQQATLSDYTSKLFLGACNTKPERWLSTPSMSLRVTTAPAAAPAAAAAAAAPDPPLT